MQHLRNPMTVKFLYTHCKDSLHFFESLFCILLILIKL
jgi:hypothetical protein